MALHPECDAAIEDVVNEAIVSDLYDSPIEIELSNLNASDKIKSVIRQEFRYIKELMDFDRKCHEIFRNWYVDGRLYYLKVIDTKSPESEIQSKHWSQRRETRASGKSLALLEPSARPKLIVLSLYGHPYFGYSFQRDGFHFDRKQIIRKATEQEYQEFKKWVDDHADRFALVKNPGTLS